MTIVIQRLINITQHSDDVGIRHGQVCQWYKFLYHAKAIGVVPKTDHRGFGHHHASDQALKRISKGVSIVIIGGT